MMLAGPIVPTILALAMPNVLNVAMQSLVSISDGWFVGQLGIVDLAALLAMDRTTLTANLKPLERRELVTTTVDPDDRRGRLVSLTRAGRTVLRAAVPIWRRVHREIDRQLSLADGKVLRGGLRALS